MSGIIPTVLTTYFFCFFLFCSDLRPGVIDAEILRHLSQPRKQLFAMNLTPSRKNPSLEKVKRLIDPVAQTFYPGESAAMIW
ncbi:hypothetical protein ASPWEDRAFT_37055 [Aspergillus wentii DTO 134E9]|uniref:Uncharacterized protein n=1 Tax=Aspergillus wentii DTO 134E9 TaxID=1073089 RepID=A0A1L9RWI8_ASPWE|nr:uncharacterized protein ASPWEDRAFT_37055 [Aspergillus wentii DTO 134E9]OJJ39296.1 hypothetical protein ASPWEDRAFT_37055 [Aspergillus wentii DTO 134E9]